MIHTSDRVEELTALMNTLAVEDGVFDTSWPGLQVARFSAPIEYKWGQMKLSA